METLLRSTVPMMKTVKVDRVQASMRKVKGTIHWVSAAHALDAEVHNYDRLFNDEAPDQHKEKTSPILLIKIPLIQNAESRTFFSQTR